MPTETLPRDDRVSDLSSPEALPDVDDDAVRTLAVRHLERVRRFRLWLVIYVLSMLVLTPVWVVTQ